MEDEIINYLKDKRGRKISISSLKHALKIKGEEQLELFNKTISTLEESSKIINLNDEVMIFPRHSCYVEGHLRVKKSGNAYVGDYLIPKELTNGALNGDLVLIATSNKMYYDKTLAMVKKIIKRKKDIINCIYLNNKLVPCEENTFINLSVPESDLSKLTNGEVVQVRIDSSIQDNIIYGRIINTTLDKNEPNYAEKLIALNHGFALNFSDEALKEAEMISEEIKDEEIKDRLDLRDELVFTIDGDNTKDMDDAVSIKILDNQNFLLGVHIAHVSHYVKRNSTLFKEAEERATSLYLNNSVIPMLPKRLSNNICSLNEGVDRLTMSTLMEIDRNGKIISFKIVPSIINSRAKLKYSTVNKLLEENENVISNQEIVHSLKDMGYLSKLLEKEKEKRGCLNFASKDYDITYDENNEAIEFNHHHQRTAEKLIENFMLCANECMAVNYSWMPFLYRIHDKPKEEELEVILDFINKNMVKIPKIKNYTNKSLQHILKYLKTTPFFEDTSDLILPTMPRAKFSTLNKGHFGLALNYYSQGTSPIRRFNDLENQSLIDISSKIDQINIDNLERYLTSVATHCSEREREADKAEAEATKLLMARHMQKHIGEEFKARIIGICSNHLMVETEDNIKGIVPINMIMGDNYVYDQTKLRYIGRGKKNTLKLGDGVLLTLDSVIVEFGLIKFSLSKKLDNHEYKTRVLKKDNK